MITQPNGDASRYRCPRCPSDHALAELIEHLEVCPDPADPGGTPALVQHERADR